MFLDDLAMPELFYRVSMVKVTWKLIFVNHEEGAQLTKSTTARGRLQT